MADSLAAARGHLSDPAQLPFEMAPAWATHRRAMRDAINGFASDRDAIAYAQQGSVTGFDHRIHTSYFANKVCAWKLHALERTFGPLPDWARESELSTSVGDGGYSTIFLTHLYYYLQIAKIPHDTVLEIGGGYGGLARIFKLANPDVRYILTDLPESLFFADVFLRANFPHATIRYAGEEGEFDFLLVPAHQTECLNGLDIDVAINTGSFQEMTEDANRFWMALLQKRTNTRHLYSFNYFLVNRKRHGETAGHVVPICPILDGGWSARSFQINPPIPTIDASGRNWLELLLIRDGGAEAEALYQRALSFPLATNPWFENILMSLWRDPSPGAIRAFQQGCAVFASGQAFGPRNFCARPRLSHGRLGQWVFRNIAYLTGRDIPHGYISGGRLVPPDVGFLRHNYYFLRALKKLALRSRRWSSPITDYSELSFWRS